MAVSPLKKARWGKNGGPGGKNYGNAFPLERLGPLCASRDRMAAAGRARQATTQEPYEHRQQR